MSEPANKELSAVELVEQGAENGGVTLTKEQCTDLVKYIEERFDEGYACGGNNAATW